MIAIDHDIMHAGVSFYVTTQSDPRDVDTFGVVVEPNAPFLETDSEWGFTDLTYSDVEDVAHAIAERILSRKEGLNP